MPEKTAKELFEEHNAVGHQGGESHVDPKNQCQCDNCTAYRAPSPKGKAAKAAADATA